MAILSIAGVPLPVLIESLSVNGEFVGDASRNVNGWKILNRRREKLIIDFTLGIKTLEETMLYRELILGQGEFFDTITSAFGSKGYQLGGTGVWSGAGGGNPNNGNGTFLCTSGQKMTIPGTFYDQTPVSTAAAAVYGATAVGWMREEATLIYRAFGFSWRAYDTVPAVKREALGTTGGLGTLGTPQAFSGAHTFAVAGTNLEVTMPASTWRFSNILVLPRYFPQAQVDMLINGRNLAQYTFPALPRLYVQSDLWPVDLIKGSPVGLYDASHIMTGEVTSLPVSPSYQAGVFTKTTLGLQGRLIEV
jgi:hypothetical protein